MTGMNVLLIAAGDSDQVEPFLALARALGEAGHDATVAAPSRFAAVADDIGVVFAGLDDSAFTLREELGRAGVGGTRSPYLTEPDLQRWLDGLAALTDIDADVVVFTRDAVGASSIADRLGVPAIPAQVVPTAPATAAFTALNAPQWTPRVLHRWTWCYGDAAPHPWRSALARWRIKRLGLRAEGTPFSVLAAERGVLSAWSRHLLPAPPDWPPSAAPLGFWTLPLGSGLTLPADVVGYLSAGDRPVLIVLDDLRRPDATRVARAIAQGLRAKHQRGVLVAGRSGLACGPVTDCLYVVDRTHLSAVMPRVSAVLHRGGIDVIAAALIAGVPQLVHPATDAQRFWAERLALLGVAPEPLDRLVPRRLADAVRRSIACGPAAEHLRGVLRDEDGVGACIARLEQAHMATR